jgi:hypothetical protein
MPLEVYKPVATTKRSIGGDSDQEEALGSEKPRRPDVRGKTFAVMRNGWKSMELLTDAIGDRLVQVGAKGVVKVHIPDGGHPEGASQQAAPDLLDSIAGRVDGTVFGLGN